MRLARKTTFVANRGHRLHPDGDRPSFLPAEFHRTIPGFRPTPLVELPEISSQLDLGGVWCKDESGRLSLDSFKILGSSWAVAERVRRETAHQPSRPLPFGVVKDVIRGMRPVLCTATDGNHGRAIAALAQWLGADSHIFMARGAAPSRVAAVEAHGGFVEKVDLSYDETVAYARAKAEESGFWYCPDIATADGGREELAFARDVTEGYTTLWRELVDELGRSPDVIVVQAGVGALAASALSAFRKQPVRVVTVEPSGSACVLASLSRGVPTAVADTPTTMSGLRCQSVSAAAWPELRDGLVGALAIEDLAAADAVRMLAAAGVAAGESGAAGLAGLLAAMQAPAARRAVGLSPTTIVAVVNTEAPTAQPGS